MKLERSRSANGPRHSGVRLRRLIQIGVTIATIAVVIPAAATAQATDPDTFIFEGPAEGSTTGDATPTFSFFSTEFPETFECELDSGSFSPCESPYTTPQLTDGTHTFRVRAIGAENNADPTPASSTFTVEADLDPPETTIDSGPAEGSTIGDPTPEFDFSSDEFNVEFQCRVDAGSFAACFAPETTAPLANGQHTFEVRATDEFGNTDATPATRTFSVVADVDPPETTITSGPADGSTVSAFTATFEFSSDEPGTFECELDDAGFNSCESPYTTPSLGNGPHTLRVRAVDEVGNADPSPASRSFTVDALRDIGSGGPLEHIYLGGELSCQVDLIGDSAYSFYPPGAQLGDCGTILATAGTVYTPDFAHHPSGSAAGGIPSDVPFTPVSQSPVTGNGSAANPFTVVTHGQRGNHGPADHPDRHLRDRGPVLPDQDRGREHRPRAADG